MPLSLLVLVATCAGADARWAGEDRQGIYRVALESVRGAGPEALVVDPRSRFLVPDEDGELRMGDFNRYGDPHLAGAIDGDPAAVPCEPTRDGPCNAALHDRFTLLSEPLSVGPREALVLASHVQVVGGVVSSTGVVLQVRQAKGAWRVTRTWEGDSVRMPPGFSR